MAVLEAKGIQKRFGSVIALQNGSLKCEKGKITGLLGMNGSGKSTVSKIITGVYNADAGEIIFNGKKVSYKNPIDAKKDGIAMVYQNLSIVPDLTVWQNIVLGTEKRKRFFLDNEVAKVTSQQIVEKLYPGLDINKKIHQLNPNEMQVVEIAKAIYGDPQLLILDEATAALELEQVQNLFKYMRELAEKGVSMIFTSHRTWEVMEICDDVVVFRNGENVGEFDFNKDGKDVDKIINAITGEANTYNVRKQYEEIDDEYALEINGLNYGKYLKNIDFKLRKGEVLGIGGLASQGQVELMLALAGNYGYIKGSATLNGKNIKLSCPSSPLRNGMLLVPGDRQLQGLFLQKTVYENIASAKLGLKKQPLFTPKKKYRSEAEEIVETLSIKTKDIDTPVNTLSGGNQQKVVVGKWLPFDISVLLLSDPAKGVDVAAKHDLYAFIMRLVKEKQMSVVLYASDSEELVSYCDRLMIMYEGEVVSILSKEEITEENITAVSMRVR